MMEQAITLRFHGTPACCERGHGVWGQERRDSVAGGGGCLFEEECGWEGEDRAGHSMTWGMEVDRASIGDRQTVGATAI